jgi:hypothetical protein
LRLSECFFDHIGRQVQPLVLRNHSLPVVRFFAVARVVQYRPDVLQEALCRQTAFCYEFAHTVIGNPGGHAWLVETYGDGYPGHALRQGLEGCIQICMRDAKGGTLQQLKLRGSRNDDHV